MEEKIKVIIVDDEERFCRTVSKILERRNLSVRYVLTGGEALEEFAKNPYDVVLLDLKMPIISGAETLKRIKESGYKAEVIIITGYPSIDTAVEVMTLGAYDYLLKPCDTEDLTTKISLAYECKLVKEKRQPK